MTTVETYKGYETARYTVERSDGTFELRRYSPQIVAEVTVQGDRSTAINRGFRLLAGYIFGGNSGGTKLAMTTPVTQIPGERIAMTTPVTQTGAGGNWVVRFLMPSSFTMDTLPTPDNAAVRFNVVRSELQAVLRFSGWARDAALDLRAAELRAWIAAQGLKPVGDAHYYFYDAPMTLPWNRRNEVAFTLAA